MNPAATYDIETEDWTRFVVGAIHYADGHTEVYRHDREREMAEALLEIDGEVYAHNGGRFDHYWLLDTLQEEADIQANTSGIVSMRFPGSPALFLDSMRIFPFGLATLSGGAKHSIEHLCKGHEHQSRLTGQVATKKCGGYCAISRKMPLRIRKVVEAYLVADVVELMRALEHFNELAYKWGFDIRRTLGSTSWHAASEELGIEPIPWDHDVWAATRAGYLGGRCEVFRKESYAGHVADVNSMYPWALTQPLPVGIPRLLEYRDAGRAFTREKPGIYHATVQVPEQWIPPLPATWKTGMAFPYGKVTGAWPLNELQYAQKYCGCEVTRVHRSVVFQDLEEVFTPWITRLFGERAKHGKATREGKWLKWIMNSLTGKLGTKCVSRRLKAFPVIENLALCTCESVREPCQCGGWRPLDVHWRVAEQLLKMRDPEPCSHPEWAAYLTGYARIKLHRQLTSGKGDAVYCDTDSCWSENPRKHLSGELGDWADEGVYRDFECWGPKCYHARVKEKEVTHVKGVTRPDWEEIRAGLPQEFFTFRGLKRANGGAFFVRDPMQRRVTPNTGRRVPGEDGDTLTYPPLSPE